MRNGIWICRQIRDGLSELVEKYLEDDVLIDEKYVLPDDETIRSEFISDVVVAVREFREWQYREVQEEEEDQKEEAP
jgi:translation elongation factor EF-Ts